jgi:DNA-binding transcriptional LysR family regulator
MRLAAAPDVSLSLLAAFCAAYREGSFAGAARVLRLRPAAVSRAVAKLEEQLGVALFRRTTRSLRASAAADRYFEEVSPALEQLARAEQALHAKGPLRGRVRISLPSTWGLFRVMPSLGAFARAHPQVALDVQVSNRVVDFVREGFDLAVRLGPIDGASLVARRLSEAPLGCYASPEYLAARGVPRTVDELAAHTLLPFVLPRAGQVLPWLMAAPDREVIPDGPYRVFDDPLGLVSLARAGVGICQTFRFMAERDVRDGTLVEVLPAHGGRVRRFSLVYPRQGVSAPARALIEHLLAHGG